MGEPERGGLRIWIDGGICIGSGNCVRFAPEAIELLSDGVAHVVDAGAADEAHLRLAERSCPTGAIFVEEVH